jgi:hypothetical protein
VFSCLTSATVQYWVFELKSYKTCWHSFTPTCSDTAETPICGKRTLLLQTTTWASNIFFPFTEVPDISIRSSFQDMGWVGSELYSRGKCFESRSEHLKFWLKLAVVFLRHFRNSGTELKVIQQTFSYMSFQILFLLKHSVFRDYVVKAIFIFLK